MKVIKTNILIYILVGIAVLVSFINYKITTEPIDLFFCIDCISKSVTVISAVSFLFVTYLWKWKIFKDWLVLIPNLNGKWKGDLQSDWVNPKSKEDVSPIEVTLTIKQSLFHISCVMNTDEMQSRSISFGYNLDSENQIKQLVYTYLSTPHQIIHDRSPIHYGSIIIDINDKGMIGNYWTDRKTTGTVKLKIEK